MDSGWEAVSSAFPAFVAAAEASDAAFQGAAQALNAGAGVVVMAHDLLPQPRHHLGEEPNEEICEDTGSRTEQGKVIYRCCTLTGDDTHWAECYYKYEWCVGASGGSGNNWWTRPYCDEVRTENYYEGHYSYCVEQANEADQEP